MRGGATRRILGSLRGLPSRDQVCVANNLLEHRTLRLDLSRYVEGRRSEVCLAPCVVEVPIHGAAEHAAMSRGCVVACVVVPPLAGQRIQSHLGIKRNRRALCAAICGQDSFPSWHRERHDPSQLAWGLNALRLVR